MPTPLIFGEKARLTPPKHWRFKQRHDAHLLPANPLAEDLDPQGSLTTLRHYMTLRRPEGHLLSAWSHVEYALNRRASLLDNELRTKYIDDAMFLLAGILGVNGLQRVNTDTRLYTDALVLNSYLPLFTKRALGQTALQTDVRNVYISNGFILNHLLSANLEGEGSYRKTKISETLGRALAAKTTRPDMILYPASHREESSAHQGENHDSYFIKYGGKIPIQKKLIDAGKEYDYPIQVLYIEELARHALDRAGVTIESEDDFPATVALAELVADETTGHELYEPETEAINFATRSIAARYRFTDMAA